MKVVKIIFEIKINEIEILSFATTGNSSLNAFYSRDKKLCEAIIQNLPEKIECEKNLFMVFAGGMNTKLFKGICWENDHKTISGYLLGE